MVLQISSQHGNITQSSLRDFTVDDFELEEIKELAIETVNMAELDLYAFALRQSLDEDLKDESEDFNDSYSHETGKVLYEPKETNHAISDLFVKETKFDEIIEEIKNKDLKKMLKARAVYFSKFNFEKIADYYAYQADENEKKIFEKLGLVLLDKDQLIENGFSNVISQLNEINK